jgi:nitrous oxidase accessory protein NosD
VLGNKNTLCNNNIVQSQKNGVGLEGSDNTVYGNAFVNNGNDGYDKGKDNVWDSGTVGNFWDRYAGKDADGNGIGDSPFIFDNISDRFPLMQKPLS